MAANPCHGIAWDESFWTLIQMEAEVQRDDDYMRELLLELEASPDWLHIGGLALGADHEEQRRHFHMRMLCDAGMLEETGRSGGVFRITNAGHDFLAMIRQNENWQATKEMARRLGGASLQMLYRIAEGYARQRLTEYGVPVA